MSKRCEHSLFKAPRLNGNVQEGSFLDAALLTDAEISTTSLVICYNLDNSLLQGW